MRLVRVWYKKQGCLKYISHLDMNRFWSRVLRKSGLPVWYTEGFNPHPYINFALPLSLGFESEYEAVDMKLLDDEMLLEDAAELLSNSTPADLTIIEVTEPKMKFNDITFAEFKIALRSETKQADTTEMEALFNSESIFCEKKSKKGTLNQVDIKPKIKSYRITETQNGLLLAIVLTAGSTDNINPMLVIKALCEKSGRDFVVLNTARTMLFNAEMEMFR